MRHEWINGAADDGRHGTRFRAFAARQTKSHDHDKAMLQALRKAKASSSDSHDDSQPLHTRLEDMPPAALAVAAAFSAASAASAMDDSLAPPDHSMLDETADGARTR